MDQRPSLIRNKLRLGFGCSGVWGQRWFSEKKAADLLAMAIENGISHFDTAGFYHQAEMRLGNGIKNFSADDIFVSTKTGTVLGRGGLTKDFSTRAIYRDVEQSLKNLGREQLDLVYLHGPNDEELKQGADILDQLKTEGKIRFSGVCSEGQYLVHAASHSAIDVIMGAYNVFRRAHEPAFATAKRNGKAVVAIAPLAQGLYRSDLFAPRSMSDGWHLLRALVKNKPELDFARRNHDILDAPDRGPAGVALGFVLANRDIDVAVTTTTKTVHLEETIDSAMKPLSDDVLGRLQAFDPSGA